MKLTTPRGARAKDGNLAHAWIDTSGMLLLQAGFLCRHAGRAAQAPVGHPVPPVLGLAPGHDVDHVLVLAAGPGQGWRFTARNATLSTDLAAAISRETRRGCEVEIVANSAVGVTALVDLLADRPLDRFDAVILAVGLTEAIDGMSVSRWEGQLRRAVELLRGRTTVSSEMLVLGIPPVRNIPGFGRLLGGVAERHGRRLDRITETLCAGAERTSYLPTEANRPSDSESDIVVEARWLIGVATAVSRRLGLHYEIDGDRRRPQPNDDDQRSRLTVNGMPVTEAEMAVVFEEIIALAHRAFRIDKPTVSIARSRSGLPILRIGSDPLTWLGEATWHELALGIDAPLLVQDTREDDRFRDDPLVVGEPHVRFFAAIPADTPGHERLGAVCVFDSSPRRRVDDVNPEQLQEFIRMVQSEFTRLVLLMEDPR